MSRVVDQTRIRTEQGKNYLAIYNKGDVVRFMPGPGDIEPTTVPEFMDIKLTDACNGNCPYCYQNSTPSGNHAPDPIGRLETYFQGVPKEQLPFQVALGGGDPLLHPQFREICKWFADRGVVPNLTTNGLNFTDDNLDVIENYCGGVAITAHRHLDGDPYAGDLCWQKGFLELQNFCDKPALHLLVSDADSVRYAYEVIEEYHDKVYAIVMLPFVNQGRAAGSETEVEWSAVDSLLDLVTDAQRRKLAWGAKAYEYIKNHPTLRNELSLYEPEMFSRYLDLTTMREYGSSFDVHELQVEALTS